MTRELAKELLLSQCKILNTYSWSDDRKAYDVPQYVLSDSKTLKLIDQIFNDHEVQLKTIKQQCLEEAEPKYEQYFSLLSDFTSLEAQLKVKDEEIEGLKAECIKLNHYKEHFEYVEETYVRY